MSTRTSPELTEENQPTPEHRQYHHMGMLPLDLMKTDKGEALCSVLTHAETRGSPTLWIMTRSRSCRVLGSLSKGACCQAWWPGVSPKTRQVNQVNCLPYFVFSFSMCAMACVQLTLKALLVVKKKNCVCVIWRRHEKRNCYHILEMCLSHTWLNVTLNCSTNTQNLTPTQAKKHITHKMADGHKQATGYF